MASEKIFVIEDDDHIRELLVYKLCGSGFDVEGFATGEQGLDAVMKQLPAMVLLDLMLPGIDGFEICRKIRGNPDTENTIVIMLTAKSEEGDKVLGLEIGADDYIVKPFSMREVAARVRANLRRRQRENKAEDREEVLTAGGLKVIYTRREAYQNGELLALKTMEFELLHFLMRHPNRVFSRKQLLDEVWGYEYVGETRTVDVHISQLRNKIHDENAKCLKTVRNVGYKFKFDQT